MSKFTKEFIAEQRKIKPASKLPFEQKWEMVPIKGKNNYLAVFGFHETESWSTGASLAMQDGNYLANAANNYPAALDEIERLNSIVAQYSDNWNSPDLRPLRSKWNPAKSIDVNCEWRDGTRSVGYWFDDLWRREDDDNPETPVRWQNIQGDNRFFFDWDGEPWPEGGEDDSK